MRRVWISAAFLTALLSCGGVAPHFAGTYVGDAQPVPRLDLWPLPTTPRPVTWTLADVATGVSAQSGTCEFSGVVDGDTIRVKSGSCVSAKLIADGTVTDGTWPEESITTCPVTFTGGTATLKGGSLTLDLNGSATCTTVTTIYEPSGYLTTGTPPTTSSFTYSGSLQAQ